MDGQTILLEGYNLVDVTNQTNLSYTPNQEISTGTYSNVSFVFGLVNEKNTDGTYNDLNAASWKKFDPHKRPVQQHPKL